MKELLLTVAVPVYKVEKYLRRCLESIIPQLNENMELLLVDDGSPDKSGHICEEYQKRYPDLIRVIHQDNHGLAYVRNVCIKEAHGKYISFIDSDDYITKGAYKHLIEIIKANNADVVCFGHFDLYKGKDPYGFDYVDSDQEVQKIYTSSEAIDLELISPDIDVITCNKIIKLSLFDGIEYPVGKLYEDMFTTYKYLAKAKCIISTSKRFYVYCHREGSIGQQKFNPRAYDLEKSAKETYEFGKHFCIKPQNLECGYIFWRVVVNNMMIRSNYKDDKFTKKTQLLIKKNWHNISNSKFLGKTRKIEYWMLGHCLAVYKVLYKFYIKKNR